MAATLSASKYSELGDDRLVARVLADDRAAFEELFARHAHPAWRLALAVCGSTDSAEHAVVEGFTATFRSLRHRTTTAATSFRLLVVKATFDAAVNGGSTVSPAVTTNASDNAMVVAYRRLPAQWRAVLWLTLVEGGTAAQAAPLVGLDADATVALAARAEAGLRDRFLQDAATHPASERCATAIERLGAYDHGTLSPADTAALDRHVNSCDDCHAMASLFLDVRAGLKALVRPMPVGLAASAEFWWSSWVAATAQASRRPLAVAAPGIPLLERLVAGAAVTVASLGLVSALLLGTESTTTKPTLATPAGSGDAAPNGGVTGVPATPTPAPAGSTAAPAPRADATVVGGTASTPGASGRRSSFARLTAANAAPPAVADLADLPRTDGPAGPTGPSGNPAPVEPEPEPSAEQATAPINVGVSLAGTPVGVSLGGPQGIGLQLGDTTIGDGAAVPTDGGVSLNLLGIPLLD